MKLVLEKEIYSDPEEKKIVLLKIKGPVNQENMPLFEKELLSLIENKYYNLILDFKETTAMNSTGVGLLINIAHKVNVVGGGVKLINLENKFKVLFNMLGLDNYLPILPDFENALKEFGVKDIKRIKILRE